MRDGFLLVVSGPSGVGKGTACGKLISQKRNIIYLASATTRKKRPYEVDGESYYFLSLDEFKKKIDQGDFTGHANVYNNYYGTPKSFVFDQTNKGEIVILETGVQGALEIKENYPEAVFIFILPPDSIELRRKIERRNAEDEETVNIRMQNAKKELSFIDEYDYVVINEDVDEAVKNIETITDAEKFRAVKGEKYD